MFKFDFDVEDVGDDDQGCIHDSRFDDSPKVSKYSGQVVQEPFSEVPLTQLLDALPSLISYSPLSIPLSSGRKLTLARRDLFDARFQLISEGAGDAVDNDIRAPREQDNKGRALEFLDAPSDLVPGVYEGGLKTWECSLDLVDYLDVINIGNTMRGKKVLEIGCGTAVPSLYILHSIFSSEAPLSGDKANGQDTHIHLQDYNRSVLELVTLPNVILAWYFSPSSASYRATEPTDSNASPRDPSIPSELPITPNLLSAFLASIVVHHISIRLFSGSWETFDLMHTDGPYNVVLTSETIYNSASLPALVGLLNAVSNLTLDDIGADGRPSYLCLVSAKVVYFGVGGGITEFVRTVEEDERGAVETVWERKMGVGRRVMRVRWKGMK